MPLSITNLWPYAHTCWSATSATTSHSCANSRSPWKTCRQVVLAEATPINQLINDNCLIYIFFTCSQSSLIYANLKWNIGSRERGGDQYRIYTCWLLRDQIGVLFRFMQILTLMIYSSYSSLVCQCINVCAARQLTQSIFECFECMFQIKDWPFVLQDPYIHFKYFNFGHQSYIAGLKNLCGHGPQQWPLSSGMCWCVQSWFYNKSWLSYIPQVHQITKGSFKLYNFKSDLPVTETCCRHVGRKSAGS